jgi:hypothetical protein
MAEEKVTKVVAENNEYIAYTDGEKELGRAGALNIRGESVAFDDGVEIYFGVRSVARVDGKMHKDGVLYIEEA